MASLCTYCDFTSHSGFGLLYLANTNRLLLGMRLLAYTSLGLRYAFDADHIDAIDNTVRKLIQQQRNPVGIGFYFSIGHSTVVFFWLSF